MAEKKIETREFKTETKKLLDLMIHSVYTNNEIFLRELISNASDALDKIRFKGLTDNDILKGDSDFRIRLEVDKDNGTLSISDNGIGMTMAEVNENIGTIARSGTLAFFEKMKNKDFDKSSLDMIGQFGIGFYSTFMVSDTVTVETLAAGKKKGVKWESTGDGKYTVEHIKKAERGTTITLKLKKKEDIDNDFMDQYKIQELIKKYSDYIRYPIEMDFSVEEKPKDEEGKIIEDAESITKIETRTLNSMVPLWEKNKKDIKEEEYFQFYKNNFHDWSDPVDVIHTKAEGTVEYTALIFIPSKVPFDFYTEGFEKGMQLYSKRVFVMEKCKELLPDYLKFVKGLVDSPDFSLNISREILQHSRQLKIIAKNVEKKILSDLKKMMKDDRKKYDEFWKEFGVALKTGIYTNFESKDKLVNLLVFETSYKVDELFALEEYVSRMPEDQKYIYYVCGKDRAGVESLPQMEALKEKKYEVLYLFDRVDEFAIERLMEFKDKKFKSVSRGDLELDGEETEEKKKNKEELQKEKKSILDAVKGKLEGKITEVRLSSRLKSSPVCLVCGDSGVSFGMEKAFSEMNNNQMFKADRILELNPEHKIFSILEDLHEKEPEGDRFSNYCDLLYSQALIIEGMELENPADFVSKLSDLMVNSK